MNQDVEQDVEQEVELRRYLLGELTLEEEVLLEQRLFLDSEYAQLAQSVEDDLIDDYVHDDMTDAEREKFKTHFLKQPEHREDLRIAESLDRYLASDVHPAAGQVDPANGTDNTDRVIVFPTPSRRNPVLWLALAAGVLILLSVITWIAFQSTRRPTGGQFQAGGSQPTPTESANPPQQPGPSPANRGTETAQHGGTPEPNKRERQPPELPGIVATVTIFPGPDTRGTGQTNEVTIRSDVTSVLLNIPVITVKDYDKYHFELVSNGRVVESRNVNVTVDEKLGRIVTAPVPAKLLKQQSYEIRLRGITSDERPGESTTYSFTVKKQQ